MLHFLHIDMIQCHYMNVDECESDHPDTCHSFKTKAVDAASQLGGRDIHQELQAHIHKKIINIAAKQEWLTISEKR